MEPASRRRRPARREAGRLVILNKIDGLWDELKTDAEVDAEIDRQVKRRRSSSAFPPSQVFAVSAQKALLAKVNGDDALLERSRLPVLEDALSRKLIPAKRDIVGAATQAEVRALAAGVRAILDARAERTSPSSWPSCARCAARTRTSSST